MPVDADEARNLAQLAHRIRLDRNLSSWDVAGVLFQLKKIAHLELPDVAMAVIRAAADPDARTPGVIPKMDAPHWRERITDPDKPSLIVRADLCRCGKHRIHPFHTRPTEDTDESGYHPFEGVDGPRTAAQLDAAARAELVETLRYAGRIPDPEIDVCETPVDDDSEDHQ